METSNHHQWLITVSRFLCGFITLFSVQFPRANQIQPYINDIGDHIYWSGLGENKFSKIWKFNMSEIDVSSDVVFDGVQWNLYDVKAVTTKDGKGFVYDLVLNILMVNHKIL